ncbi:MAG: FAD-binding oxidoreductase [Alphaproteobacteria bacterium]|nr:FAD-binding oxidoreductase [Alphaproteobacteria bacterium]
MQTRHGRTAAPSCGSTPQPTTWYHASARPFAALAPLDETVDADVCVVGGGLTGVSAALALAERGYRVILLEAGRIGDGASGRNGGQLVTGFSCDMRELRRHAGLAASRDMWDMGIEAMDLVRSRVARHEIDCDLRRGYLFAAGTPRQRADLAGTAEDWASVYRYTGPRLLARPDLARLVGSDSYVAGLADPGGGQIHPLEYLRGLAAAARLAGAAMFEHSRVLAVERTGARSCVRTARAEVRARFVVLAGNAYLEGLHPPLHARLAAVASHVAVTPPLPADTLRRIMPGNVAVCDWAPAPDYYRVTGDGRLLFGAGARYRPGDNGGRDRFLKRRIARVFPSLDPVELDCSWTGLIGVTRTRIPDIGRSGPDLFHAQGFSGHGVALTGLAGTLVAEAVAGTAERFDVFAALRHRPFPGGVMRGPLLALAVNWYRLRDRLG